MSDTDFMEGHSPLLQIRLMWAFRITVTALVSLIVWLVSGSLAESKAMQKSLGELKDNITELKQTIAVMQAEQKMRDLKR